MVMQIFREPPLQKLSSVEPGPERTKLLLKKLRLCSVPQAVLLSAAAIHMTASDPSSPGCVCASSYMYTASVDAYAARQSSTPWSFSPRLGPFPHASVHCNESARPYKT